MRLEYCGKAVMTGAFPLHINPKRSGLNFLAYDVIGQTRVFSCPEKLSYLSRCRFDAYPRLKLCLPEYQMKVYSGRYVE